MSGEPPEGILPPLASAPRARQTDVDDHDDAASTERMPKLAAVDDGPPEIRRFLSPPPVADRPSEVPPSSSSARRRSRRTVKIPADAAPPPPFANAAPSAPLVAAPAAAPPAQPPVEEPRIPAQAPAEARAEDPEDTRVTAVRDAAAKSAAPRAPSDRVRLSPNAPRPAIPPAPPVPVLAAKGFGAPKPEASAGGLAGAAPHRENYAPTLRTVPRPAPLPGAADEARAPRPSVEPPVPLPAAYDDAEVIRPMRIISIGPSQPPPAEAPPPALPEPPPPRSAAPTLPAPEELAARGPSDVASARPAKPPLPVVEEVDEIEEVEPAADTEPRASRTDEIEPFPIEDEDSGDLDAERLSDADLGAHADEDVPVDLEEPAPKKPPPPPPKRATSMDPPPAPAPPAPAAVTPVAAAPAAPAAPASSAAVALDPSRKRVKPWWEEIFSDDFIRTLEKVDKKVIRKECDFIEDRLGLEKGAVMLDLACGSGDHAVELATRGYNVVGYDLSLAMLARAQDEAQERGQKINFLQGDIREMAFEEAFDGMYSWSTSFGYFDDDKNVDVLKRVHRGLRQGGIFLLDVINRDYVCPRQPSLVWFEGDGCVCMDEMHVDFFTSRLRVKRTVMFDDGRSRECEYSIRLYGLHELGKMLHDTGFKVVEVTGHPAHPGVFFGSESPRIIVLAERG